MGDQITLNKNNEIKINDIYLNLSFYKNRISKIDNQIEFMKEKLNNTKLNVKNESEDLKKGIEKSMKIGPESASGASTRLPLVILADTSNNVYFLSEGYTIGLGEQLAASVAKL